MTSCPQAASFATNMTGGLGTERRIRLMRAVPAGLTNQPRRTEMADLSVTAVLVRDGPVAPDRRSARHAGRGVASLVTHRGVSRAAAEVMAGCISAGARSRACRRQTGQRGLCLRSRWVEP